MTCNNFTTLDKPKFTTMTTNTSFIRYAVNRAEGDFIAFVLVLIFSIVPLLKLKFPLFTELLFTFSCWMIAYGIYYHINRQRIKHNRRIIGVKTIRASFNIRKRITDTFVNLIDRIYSLRQQEKDLEYEGFPVYEPNSIKIGCIPAMAFMIAFVLVLILGTILMVIALI